jgi:biopolymer transport protein ExbD
MIKSKKTVTENAEVDMNSMLDVVFILLIFFIVTTTFARAQAIEAERPKSNIKSVTTSKSVLIQINHDNSILLDNRVMDPERISVNIARISANFDIKSVQINASENSTHQVLMTVMDQVKTMGNYPIAITSKTI